jgi:lysophospholipase L1-like esterase
MIIHIMYFVGLILAIPFFPILILQAKKVKRSVPRLLEADVNIKGSIGVNTESIRLITLGESTIAGVGLKDHADGITGQIAKSISIRTNKKVEWEVIAKSGYAVKKVAEHLVSKIPDSRIDLILIGVGANDTFEFNSTLTWQRNLTQLIINIRKKHTDSPIVFINMPPIGQLLAFPKVMRVILGSLITLHGLVLKSILSKHSNVYYVNKRIRFVDWAKKCDNNVSIKDLFCDGVHPSALAYAIWGNEVGEFIIERKLI